MEETYERSIFEEETSVIYGGFWERFGALILDWLILLPLTILNVFNSRSWKSEFLLIIVSLLAMIYKPLLEYLYGATPGKKALSLVVVTDNYEKISGKEAILRNIFGLIIGVAGIIISLYALPDMGKTPKAITGLDDIDSNMVVSVLFSLVLFLLYLADAICLVANNRKKSIHDFIGRTLVTRKR